MASSAASGGPLLRLAANGQAVAATSQHLGRGRKVPRCRGIFAQGLDVTEHSKPARRERLKTGHPGAGAGVWVNAAGDATALA
jgi:hypothetical protein